MLISQKDDGSIYVVVSREDLRKAMANAKISGEIEAALTLLVSDFRASIEPIIQSIAKTEAPDAQ